MSENNLNENNVDNNDSEITGETKNDISAHDSHLIWDYTPILPKIPKIDMSGINNLVSSTSKIISDTSATYLESIQRATESAVAVVSKMAESMNAVISSSYQPIINITSAFSSFAEKLVKIDFSPIVNALANLNFDINIDKYEEEYLSAMYEAKWFPRAGYDISIDMWFDINEILEITKPSKKRTTLIDDRVYAYYTKTKIEEIKRGWGKLQIPNYSKRILREAVKAYHRGEFATTAIVLASMWEGMVTEKIASHPDFKDMKKRERFHTLVSESHFSELINQFYDEYIAYGCSSKNEVIRDVPGRNASMHGWYNSYPTKKAALNAILFTDFLLNLKPATQKQEETTNTDD